MDRMILSIKGNLLFHFLYILLFCVFILFDDEFSFSESVYMIFVLPIYFLIGIPIYYFSGRISSSFTKNPKVKVVLLIVFYTLYYLVLLSSIFNEPPFITNIILYFFSDSIGMPFKYLGSYIISWFLVITQFKDHGKTLEKKYNNK